MCVPFAMSQVTEFPLVWITGASTGIGRALAMRLADHGSTVLASARDASKLAELEAASNDLVGHIIALPLDVTDNDGVRAAYERIFAEHGVPDLCVLNAGTYIPTDGAIFSADAYRQIDMTGWVSSACLTPSFPAWCPAGRRIAVVGSVSGYRGLRTAAAYGAPRRR